jgi:hypothetical protein
VFAHVNPIPLAVLHFALAHSGQLKEPKPTPLFFVARRVELHQVIVFVYLWSLFVVVRPVVLPDARDFVTERLKEPHDGCELIPDAAVGLFLLVREYVLKANKSRRSMSSTYVFLQDSRKYRRAVVYAESVFEDLCALMSAR